MQNMPFVLQIMSFYNSYPYVYLRTLPDRLWAFTPILLSDVQHFFGRLQGRRSFL